MSRLTSSKQWNTLQEHYFNIKNLKLKDIFQYDEDRFDRYSYKLNGITYDLSKNRINFDTVSHLISLAKFTSLHRNIPKLFDDNTLNYTEDRAVLHTALRDTSDKQIHHQYINIKSFINAEKEKIKIISDKINTLNWKSDDNTINNIVFIGIGGSFQGPKLITDALTKYHKKDININFISNFDYNELEAIFDKSNPKNTLFVITTKSFNTDETLTNANTAKQWLLDNNISPDNINNHFLAITSNSEKAEQFGIKPENILNTWDWVGGRFSLWSVVGLPIAIKCGYEVFEQLLNGAEIADNHFQNADLDENIPVLLALIDIWYINFFNVKSKAVFSYNQPLAELPNYLQQLNTESNGKRIDKKGEKVDYQTAIPIWGGVCTNMQHSVFQMLHQGTSLTPVEFIAIAKDNGNPLHNKKLLSNFLAQSRAFMNGRNINEVPDSDPNKEFPGNIPSTSILIDELTPSSLGTLLAIYEHKIITMGLIWNINSFDQFGVELGKEIALEIEDKFESSETNNFDSSTNNLLKIIKDINNY